MAFRWSSTSCPDGETAKGAERVSSPDQGGDQRQDRERLEEDRERPEAERPAESGRRLPGRRSLRERLGVIRDYGPGSGSIDALLRGGGVGIGARTGAGRRRVVGAWRSIPELGRQRLAAGLIVLGLVALTWFALLPLGPCGLPGNESCAPSDDAIELVPADALAYAHLSLDFNDEQYERLAEVAARAPGLSKAALAAFAAGPFGALAPGSMRRWAGDEAAVCSLPIGVDVQRAALIAVADETAARRFAERSLGRDAETESVQGVTIQVSSGGGERARAAAFFAGFAVLGERGAVRAVVSRWTAQGPPLSADPDAAGAIAELPERRAAYAYLSPTGAGDLLDGGLRGLGPLVDPAATAGVAASVTVSDDRLAVAVRSVLDPELSRKSIGAVEALAPFEPTLVSAVGPRALVYLGLGDPAAALDSLRSAADQTLSQLPEELEDAVRGLEKGAGVDLAGELLPLLGSQVALAVQPVGGAEGAGGVVAGAGAPFATLIADGVDSRQAARVLAELQEPVAAALAGDGPPQRFETIQVAGVAAQTLPVSAAIDLTYATWDDRLVITTDPLGIEQARSQGPGLDSASAYADAVEGLPERPALFAYLNASEIMGLAEQVGFATDPAYAALAPELRVFRSAALAVTATDLLVAADLNLPISEE